VDREHAEPLFWWAAHLGRWLSRKDLVTQVRHRTRLTAALEKVGALDGQILAGSLYRTWGAYYAHRGDMAKARENFERAAEIAPFMLLTRLMYARECAVPAGDKDLFVRQLTLALQEPEPDIPEILPEFRLYRGRARDLLERTQEFFPY
jgi:tetratricopeptide (TPR) repeat protein